MFENLIHNSEKYILRFLIIILLVFICFQIINLIHQFFYFLINYDFSLNILTQFPFDDIAVIFFDVLIAVELMETLKHNAGTVTEKAKLIILIGLIAVTRKLITIDQSNVEYTTDIALAVLIISLTAGYFLLSNKSKKE